MATCWDRYFLHLNKDELKQKTDRIEEICKKNDLSRGSSMAMALVARVQYLDLDRIDYIYINGRKIYVCANPTKPIRELLSLADHHNMRRLFFDK